MFNPENWNWAMYAYVALQLFSLGIVVAQHGEPKKGYENAWTTIIALILVSSLLYFAGAFK